MWIDWTIKALNIFCSRIYRINITRKQHWTVSHITQQFLIQISFCSSKLLKHIILVCGCITRSYLDIFEEFRATANR